MHQITFFDVYSFHCLVDISIIIEIIIGKKKSEQELKFISELFCDLGYPSDTVQSSVSAKIEQC